MNAPKIIGTVGIGGINQHPDVVVVQQLINQCIKAIVPRSPLVVDGRYGGLTIEAIKEFQRRVIRLQVPDGRVDPGGHTFQALAAYAAGKVPVIPRLDLVHAPGNGARPVAVSCANPSVKFTQDPNEVVAIRTVPTVGGGGRSR